MRGREFRMELVLSCAVYEGHDRKIRLSYTEGFSSAHGISESLTSRGVHQL